MTNENYIDDGNAEYGIDSRYNSDKEKEADAIALMQARLDRMKNVSKKDIVRAKLLQLKLKMESYLKQPNYTDQHNFATFLETYIDIIYSKRNQFAEDISISPVLLSQIINKHREPKNEFLLKLVIHSEKTFEKVCEFNGKTWYQVYFNEKINDTMSRQNEWWPKIEKQIKVNPLL